MRSLLSIPVALVLAAAIHVDWHLARPHDHGGLSGGLAYHWLLAIPVFAAAAWYLARRSAHPVAAGGVAIAAAAFLGQGLEPLGEYLAYGEPFSESFAPHRLGAFTAFMAAGIGSYALVMWRLPRRIVAAVWLLALPSSVVAQQLRVSLAKQPFSPNGVSAGPTTMATGGIQDTLARLGVRVRVDEAALTPAENTEYGGWKRLGMALGHYADIVARNERDGYFTVGLLATCPSMPGLVAGLQHSGPSGAPLRIAMLWLDAHPDFNTPETTRSGSLGGMPVAVATGRALHRLRRDAKLDPPLADSLIVMGGVRLTDPLEQELLDSSAIAQLTVDDLRRQTPAVFAQLDRLSRRADKIYVHIDMDVLDPREVMGHQNKVPGGPTSAELAGLFETIFRRYPKAVAIGFATIPTTDEGGIALAAVNRMILGAIRGVQSR